MAETHRIHPASVPLPINTPFPSKKPNPAHNTQYQPTIHSLARPPTSNRNCCCRLICCIFSLILTLLITIAILGAIFYFVYKPKAPNFSINWLRITDLRLNLDLSLYAKFDVRITTHNPNKKIGIYYEKGGKTSVWYTKTELCRGSLLAFYQGALNTTQLELSLEGQNEYGNTLMSALQQQQQTGNVPLDLKVDQPVAIRVGSVKLGKVRFLVKCKLIVDSLSSTNLISIKTSSCSIRVKL